MSLLRLYPVLLVVYLSGWVLWTTERFRVQRALDPLKHCVMLPDFSSPSRDSVHLPSNSVKLATGLREKELQQSGNYLPSKGKE